MIAAQDQVCGSKLSAAQFPARSGESPAASSVIATFVIDLIAGGLDQQRRAARAPAIAKLAAITTGCAEQIDGMASIWLDFGRGEGKQGGDRHRGDPL